MMDCTDMSSVTDIKPKIIDLEDNESSVSEASRKGFDDSPAWILEFTIECLKINGLRSPARLDQLMGDYLELLRAELLLCQQSPNRSQHIVFRMQKTLTFFYNYFLDIKEMFFVTQWNENMVELMAIYSFLEIKASLRANRRDSDLCIASRIYKLLYLYFDGNEEHIIHTFLKTPLHNLKCKGIYELMFRKVLVTNRSKRTQSYTDLEYVRNLLCYKLWKSMCARIDKKSVTDLAIKYNKPPATMAKNLRKYRFIPKFLDHTDLNLSLSTCIFQIDDGIREYFERHEPKNGKHFGSIVSKERKTFISRLYDVFCESDSTTENIGDSFMDNILLDQIKTETEAIQLDDEDSDDDCVFVDPNEQPLPTPPPKAPVLKMIIDLTSNEPDLDSETTDLTPTWCKALLEQAKLTEKLLQSPIASLNIDDQTTITNNSELTDTFEPAFTGFATSNTSNLTKEDCDIIKLANDTQASGMDINDTLNETPIDISTFDESIHIPIDPQSLNYDSLKHSTPKLNINSDLIHSTPYPPDLDKTNGGTSTNTTNKQLNDELATSETDITITNVEHVPLIRCKSVDLAPEFKAPLESKSFALANVNDVEEVLTHLDPILDIYDAVNEPLRVINRENINKTPLDIIDDFCSSDEDGFSEITSTSHDFEPVKLQPILLQAQFEAPVLKSTPSSFELPPRSKTPFPMLLTNRVKTPTQLSKKLIVNGVTNDWDQSVDKVDSTSGLNEDSCLTTLRPLLIEQTNQLRRVTDVSKEPVINAFGKPSTDHSIEMIVSAPKIATKVHDLSKLVPQFKECSDTESETENNLVINSHNTNDEKIESDDQSPSMEPICGKDYAGYLNDFSLTTFADVQRESLQNADLTVNKTVKIRTYNSIKPRPKPIVLPAVTPSVSAPERDRRVPVNGEKILRFETELWEPVYINTFKLTKKEFNLFNPQINVSKCDKRDFGIHDDDELVFRVSKPCASAVNANASNSYEALHSQLFNVARTNSILERQDYVKGAKQTRALVQTRPLRSRSETSRNSGELTSLKSPNSVNQAKKRGIDLNLLFSTSDCSVSLNNSFQHHFCSDISTCSSNCVSPTLNLSTSLDGSPNPQLKNHVNDPLDTFTTHQIPPITNPELKVPNYQISDKIPQIIPNDPKLNPLPTQICDKLPTTVPNHPNLQFNVQICDETIPNQPNLQSKPQHNPEPNPAHLTPIPHHPNAQIRVNFSHTDPAGLDNPTHPTIHLNQDAQTSNHANPQLNANLQFKLQICDDVPQNNPNPKIINHPTEIKAQFNPPPDPMLPPPAPQPAQIPDLNTYWQTVDPDKQILGTNLLVNINVDQTNADHEIHLPIKKRRVSSLKVEIKDEISYPSTPMISIAELENIKTEQRNLRPFKTPAELKEVPPLPPSYLLTVPNHVVTDNLNINHTFNNPTINYHVNNVPVINFQYTPHYHQLPPLQPILVPVTRTANWQQPGYGYLPTGKVVTATSTGKKRNSRATERKKTKAKS